MPMKMIRTVLLLMLWTLIQYIGAEVPSQPNIVFIMADDLGYNDVSYHGSEIWTPNIDQLAIEGVRLENYYMSPSCGPSRAQFMSGRYNIHTGTHHGNFFPCKPYGLPLEYPTLAEELKNLGYGTHMIGKWHLGHHRSSYLPTRRGFDTFRGSLTGSGDHYTHMKSYGRQAALDFYEGEEPLNSTFGYYSTHLYTRRAENIIKSYNATPGEPFFIWLSYQAPHSPLQVPESYEEPYSFIPDQSRRTFAGMVSALDEGVGKVVNTLKQAGMYNNTLIVFSTDNGGQQLRGSSNYPLRGNKDTMYEAGIRGVGLVSGPLLQREGAVNRELMHMTDWMPTLLHLAGGNASHLDVDGIDQWNSLSTGAPSLREEILYNIDPKKTTDHETSDSTEFDTRVQAAIRWQDWKLLTGDPGYPLWVPEPKANYETYSRAAKRVTNKGNNMADKMVLLYNIRVDPYETINLVNVRPDIAMNLLGRLARYDNSSLPVQDPKNDRRCNPWLHGNVWGPYLDRDIQRRRPKPRPDPKHTIHKLAKISEPHFSRIIDIHQVEAGEERRTSSKRVQNLLNKNRNDGDII